MPDGTISFFNRKKIPECIVLTQSLRVGLKRLFALAERHPDTFRGFAHAEVREQDLDGKWAVSFADAAGVAQPLSAKARTLLTDDFICWQPGAPVPNQRFPLIDGRFVFVPITGFMQVNHAVNARLISRVQQTTAKSQSVLDLFAGAGNFSLALAAPNRSVLAVESHIESTSALQSAAQAQAHNIATLTGDAAVEIASLKEQGRKFDAVVCDPPRAGLKTILPTIANLATDTIALVSCHAQTLGRDVRGLVNAGWSADRGWLFDMFAHTRHVEALVVLRRR